MKIPKTSLILLGAMIAYTGVSAYSYSSSTGCLDSRIGDGWCHQNNNNAECGYDGGDCCRCTCTNGDWICGEVSQYACIDPSAPCVGEDNITAEMVENCGDVWDIGDGYCNQDNNKAVCLYDGGDCCSCTCVSPETTQGDDDYSDYLCTEEYADFACIDPDAPCSSDDDVTVDMVANCGWIPGIGDGYCDPENNNAFCGYDGGDCCGCTCVAPEGDTSACQDLQCVDPNAPCSADDDATVDMVEACGYPGSIGNGYCDIMNNNEICRYDGGDCCECTRVAPEIDLGHYHSSSTELKFACVDPNASCFGEDGITVEMIENCPQLLRIGDGYCNSVNNNEVCGYDGGDCCACTCVPPDGNDYACTVASGLACLDPSAPCVDDDSVTIAMVGVCGDIKGIGNGYCDIDNNRAECAYDGGDCCECTCKAGGDEDSCSRSIGFACVDPEAACVDDDFVTVEMLDICPYPQRIGNGYCDDSNNTPECAYDGGDCCKCTCVPNEGDDPGCDQLSCIDPSASCVDDDDITVDMYENCGYPSQIGDGYCDIENNKPECNYDGGDCCECTCEYTGDDDNGCSRRRPRFACIDPSASCVDDDFVTTEMLDICPWVLGIGDGFCEEGNNNPECAYDGGDCCECTCVKVAGDVEECSEFSCIDPSASCSEDDDITVDMYENCGDVLGIGDGFCDRQNNREECNYDGGDCCSCTCEPIGLFDDVFACSVDGSGFNCKDPLAECFGEDPTSPMNGGDLGGQGFSMSFSFVDGFPMSYSFVPWVQEGALPTVPDAVEVGTVTEVGVEASGYDMRPGASGIQIGCGPVGGGGCVPEYTRDGIISDVESRWSCSRKVVNGEGPCQIRYTFAEPQNIVEIQIAFWKADQRIRTLEVHLDDTLSLTHESTSGSAFNTLAVNGNDVTTVMIEAVGLLSDEWISLLEVLILVVP